MPQFYTNEACIASAKEMQTALAASKVRLFKSSFIPNVSTVKADLEAAECEFTGYTSAGMAITTWNNPLLAPAGGAVISSPTLQFEVGPAPVTATDLVGGFWIEDTSGDVRAVGQFAAPIPMEVVGQGFPLNISLGFPTGQTI